MQYGSSIVVPVLLILCQELAYIVARRDKGRGGVGRYIVLSTVVHDLQSVLAKL